MSMKTLNVSRIAMVMMTTRPDAPEELGDRLPAALSQRRDGVVAVVDRELDPPRGQADDAVGQPGEEPDPEHPRAAANELLAVDPKDRADPADDFTEREERNEVEREHGPGLRASPNLETPAGASQPEAAARYSIRVATTGTCRALHHAQDRLRRVEAEGQREPSGLGDEARERVRGAWDLWEVRSADDDLKRAPGDERVGRENRGSCSTRSRTRLQRRRRYPRSCAGEEGASAGAQVEWPPGNAHPGAEELPGVCEAQRAAERVG